MSSESHTTINIAKATGRKKFGGGDEHSHFFRVNITAHPENHEVVEVLASLKKAYPEPKFQIDVTYWQCSGQRFDS